MRAGATLWKVVLALSLVLLVLLAFSFPGHEPGSASRTVAHLSPIVLGVTIAGTVALIRLDWGPFS